MTRAHPEELGSQLLDLVAEDDRHPGLEAGLLGLHQHWHHSVVLVPGHLCGLLVLDQSEVKVLLAGFLDGVGVLVQLDLFVQFLGVDLGDVLHHHCDVLRVEGALGYGGGVLRIFSCSRCFRR